MKHILITIALFCYTVLAFGQPEAQQFKDKRLQDSDFSVPEFKTQLIHYDFSKLFTQADNSVVYGFIGKDYERIRIKFIAVTKSKALANTYYVYGKSMVKSNICEFRGSVIISTIRQRKVTSGGVDDMYKNTGIKGQFMMIGDYLFSENKKQSHAGQFKGIFATYFYIDKDGNARYDDINSVSDNFTNNQFVGGWSLYKGKLTERCNWGDFRIPNSGDLDTGAGEFSPDPKYLKNGWQTRADQLTQKQGAKEAEMADWWK